MLHKNNTPIGDVSTSPTINDLLSLAREETTQEQLAASLGISPPTFSRKVGKWACNALLELSSSHEALKSKFQSTRAEFQALKSSTANVKYDEAKISELETEISEMKLRFHAVKSEGENMKSEFHKMKSREGEISRREMEVSKNETEFHRLKLESDRMKSSLNEISQNQYIISQLETDLKLAGNKISHLEAFKARHEKWAEMNILEKFLSGGWARLLVLGMLVFYEADVTRQLLIEKDIENPFVIAFGIGLAFLVFASSRNIWGQVFIIGYSLFTSGCLFDIFSFDIGWVFLLAFPCIVAAVMKPFKSNMS
jgi:DNA repair exonuclease SbcCD ATPase subunit